MGVRVDFTFYFTFAYFEFLCCFYFYISSIWKKKKKTAIFLEKVWLFLKALYDSQTYIFPDCTIGINVEKKIILEILQTEKFKKSLK